MRRSTALESRWLEQSSGNSGFATSFSKSIGIASVDCRQYAACHVAEAAVTRQEFEQVVDRVLDRLPEWVVEQLDNLVVVVEDSPTPEQDPHGEGLLGLYEGVSLLERSADYWGALPDQITIFRRPHLALHLPRTELEDEIRRTVLHELAHHLGIDDERLTDLGWD